MQSKNLKVARLAQRIGEYNLEVNKFLYDSVSLVELTSSLNVLSARYLQLEFDLLTLFPNADVSLYLSNVETSTPVILDFEEIRDMLDNEELRDETKKSI